MIFSGVDEAKQQLSRANPSNISNMRLELKTIVKKPFSAVLVVNHHNRNRLSIPNVIRE